MAATVDRLLKPWHFVNKSLICLRTMFQEGSGGPLSFREVGLLGPAPYSAVFLGAGVRVRPTLTTSCPRRLTIPAHMPACAAEGRLCGH